MAVPIFHLMVHLPQVIFFFVWAADWIGLKASSRDTWVTYISHDGALSVVVCSVIDYLMSLLSKVDAFSTVP